MPSISNAQAIGSTGERWFHAHLPNRWILQRPTTDIGVDGVVVICDDDISNGLEFRVQIKTVKKLQSRSTFINIAKIKTSTLRYWFSSPAPLLVVVVDLHTGLGRYGWHFDALEEPERALTSASRRHTIKISKQMILNDAAWSSIKNFVTDYYVSLQNQLQSQSINVALVSFTNDLISCVQDLRTIEGLNLDPNAIVPVSAHLKDMQFELHAHRRALDAIKRLSSQCRPGNFDNFYTIYILAIEAVCYTVLKILTELLKPAGLEKSQFRRPCSKA
jgi:hypothetical protein